MLHENLVFTSPHGARPIGLDVRGEADQPLIVFVHGWVGFKDWGAHNLVADAFAKAGFLYAKLNFSHNGTTPEHPTEFVDLEAFSEDNYSKQLDDLQVVLDALIERFAPPQVILIGHSLGAGVVLAKAAEDPRVTHVVGWAPVANLGFRWNEDDLAGWKEAGVIYYPNSRTGQQMPIKWQRAEDFLENRDRLELERLVPRLKIPLLFVVAADDGHVPTSHSKQLQAWAPQAKIVVIKEGGHTFGAKHPWEKKSLPQPLRDAVDETTKFLSGR